MMKATPRSGGAAAAGSGPGDRALLPLPQPPSLAATSSSSVHSVDVIAQQTPRSERMMGRLRDGLGEYIRLYNPVSSNWRKMNASVARDQQQHGGGASHVGTSHGGRHSVDLGRTGYTSDGDNSDVASSGLHKTKRGGNIPRLHILHSDSESDDDGDVSNKLLHGSVRSMPNLTYRGGQTFRAANTYRAPDGQQALDSTRLQVAPPASERSLSTISSDDEDNLYTSRRENMRQTLKLMGGDTSSRRAKRTDRTPRQRRDRKHAMKADNKTDSEQSTAEDSSNRGKPAKKLLHSKSRASLDVITEAQATSESQTPVRTPATDEKKASLTSDDVISGAKRSSHESLQKRGSRATLMRNGSRKSLDEPAAAAGASTGSQLSKKGSVAALRARRRRQMLASKFRMVCRLFINLYRLWKAHSINVAKMMENFDSLDALVAPKQEKDQLLFDLSLFKSSDEAKIPADAKAILHKQPRLRTEDELRYLKIALRNYEAIAEYPMHMQELISRRAWFEGYDQKRVMVREGHEPQNFYFILSGSVVVSRYDPKHETNKTVCFMGRGDSFGELAIINRTTRDCTVITKETSQFLVLRDEDFLEIFTSGGLGNPKDPFLTSLWYLRNWPLHLLKENPKKAVFSFFRRGVVLAPDTNASDWLYIVKSGSLSVYKQLKFESPDARKPRKVQRKRKPQLKKLYAEHEDTLQYTFDRQISSLEHRQLLNRMMQQPIELNIEVNNIADAYQKTPKLTAENTINLGRDSTSVTVSGLRRERSTVSVENTTVNSKRKKVSFSVTGPILTKSNMDPNPPAQLKEIDPSKLAVLSETFSRYDQDDLPDMQQHVPRWKLPMFVIIQTLIKGSYFGLNALVYKTQKQPKFSLVSNGAEVIMIDKRFYEEHCSQRLMTDLREQIYPFPMDDVLQDMLKRTINWDHNCKATFSQSLHKIRLKNADVSDARSTLTLQKPPEVPPRPT